MLRKTLGALMISASLWSCGNPGKSAESSDATAGANTQVDTSANTAANTAATDFTGTYKGTTPCADCDGIEVALTLNSDQTFKKTQKYLGMAGSKPIETAGKFSVDAATNTVTLEGVKDEPSKYLIEGGNLTQLDLEGKKIEGGTAKMYILTKQK